MRIPLAAFIAMLENEKGEPINWQLLDVGFREFYELDHMISVPSVVTSGEQIATTGYSHTASR